MYEDKLLVSSKVVCIIWIIILEKIKCAESRKIVCNHFAPLGTLECLQYCQNSTHDKMYIFRHELDFKPDAKPSGCLFLQLERDGSFIVHKSNGQILVVLIKVATSAA